MANVKELVERAQQEAGGALNKLPAVQAQRLVRSVFQQIATELRSAPDGAVKIPGLGTFRIRSLEREMEGAKVSVRRVTFRPGKELTTEDRAARRERKAPRKASRK
jgi:nucleoid DNA-binding protein